MEYLVTNENIVIAAKDINLSIFKPPWLMKSKIFRQEELEGAIAITPVMVQIADTVVLPNRIQFNIRPDMKDVTANIDRVMGGIVRTLPHTPYTAVGMNYNYIAKPDSSEDFAIWNHNWFASSLDASISYLKDSNPRYGSYFSFDFMDTRAKVDLKPSHLEAVKTELAKQWQTGQEVLTVNFNFHKDVINSEDPVSEVLKVFGIWERAREVSKEIIQTMCK